MIEVAALATVLLLFRVAAFVAFLPPFFGRNVPQTVKVGLAVGLTLLWIPQQVAIAAPELAWTIGPEPRWGALGYLVIRETLFGIGLAWLLGLALVPVRIGGSYVAQEMGLTLGAITSSTDQQASNVISEAFEALAILVLFTTNLHHTPLRLFDACLEWNPVGQFPKDSLPGSEWVVSHVSWIIQQGLVIVAPVAVLMLLATAAMLVTMRLVPQLNLFTFGMPARVGVGMLGLILFFPEVIASVHRVLKHATSHLFL